METLTKANGQQHLHPKYKLNSRESSNEAKVFGSRTEPLKRALKRDLKLERRIQRILKQKMLLFCKPLFISCVLVLYLNKQCYSVVGLTGAGKSNVRFISRVVGTALTLASVH